jgi:hypothetical protein
MYRAATNNYGVVGGSIVAFNWDAATVITNNVVTYTTAGSSSYGVAYFTVLISGQYSVGFDLVFSPALLSTDHFEIWVAINSGGITPPLTRLGLTTVGPNSTSAGTNVLLSLSANDQLSFYGYFYTSNTPTIENTTTQSWAYVARVSPT